MNTAVIADIISALEAAIVALFALFAVFAFLRARNGVPALYFLAAAAGLIALMLSGNFLAAEFSTLNWTNTLNVALELLTIAAIYLYIRQARHSAHPITLSAGLLAAPAALGIGLRYIAVGLVDPFIIVTSFIFLAASFSQIIRFRNDYPAGFKKFAIPLLSVFTLVWIFRTMVTVNTKLANGNLTLIAYVLLLGAILAAASLILFTALYKPNIVSAIWPAPKYVREQANKEELAALANILSDYLSREKPFLKPDLTLEELAGRLGASPRQVSQLINSEYGANFSSHMNTQRISFAKQLLKKTSTDTPIKTIMYDSGFRSKSVFNREFLKNCGQTPSQFREERDKADLEE